jgi:hypothetical protein
MIPAPTQNCPQAANSRRVGKNLLKAFACGGFARIFGMLLQKGDDALPG